MNTISTKRVIDINGKQAVLIGTAHISEQSAREVAAAVDAYNPQCICIELDAQRLKALQSDRRWQELNIRQIIRRKQGMMLFASILLSNFQRRIAQSLKVEPGAEMKVATKIATERDIPLILCDRKIQTTFVRAWRLAGLWNKCKLIALLIGSMFERRAISEEEVESLKQEDMLNSMLAEMSRYLPLFKRVFIEERDQYLAARIYEALRNRSTAVAVIGAGHLEGVTRRLRELLRARGENDPRADAATHAAVLADLNALDEAPPPSKAGKFLKIGFSVAIAVLIVSGFFFGDTERGIQNITYWVLVNGIAATAGSLLALAHPATVISSFLFAPLTSLNPTIGVGFVAAIVESVFRKPRARDLQNIATDSQTLKGFYRNRVTRILLVFILSSIGSAIGTFVALPLLLR